MLPLVPFLILTIVGGYYFSEICLLTTYKAAREEGHRLYFRAIIVGVILALIAIFLHWAVFRWFGTGYLALLKELSPSLGRDDCIVHPFGSESCPVHPFGREGIFVVLFASMFLGLMLAYLINVVIKLLDATIFKDKSIPMLSEKEVDIGYLRARLLFEAVRTYDFELMVFSAWVQQTLLLITLRNGKFYIGAVLSAPNPRAQRKHIKIMPFFSGYRTKKHRVRITTDYLEVYKDFDDHPDAYHLGEDRFYESFDVVIPSEEIVSAHPYDDDVYDFFNKGRNTT